LIVQTPHQLERDRRTVTCTRTRQRAQRREHAILQIVGIAVLPMPVLIHPCNGGGDGGEPLRAHNRGLLRMG
jgi:hypothetical protein